MNKKLDKKRNIDFYLLYTLVFLAVALALYLKFFANEKSLVWSHDGVPQHLNSLAYYGKYLRKVLHTLFIEHKLSLPLWDMHIGYGSDILTTLHYYVIGDPLTLLSVFVPASKTEALYAFLIFLRIYLAGIAFSRYSFYHKNSKQATFMGTMIYIFAGWTIYAAMKHPYFSNPMIYLPLILLGIDKIYKKQKPYVFIWSVALAGLSNFYFFYMLGIFMVLYAIFRYFDLFADRELKGIVSDCEDRYDYLEKLIHFPEMGIRESYLKKQSAGFVGEMEGFLAVLEDQLMDFKPVKIRTLEKTEEELIHLFYFKFQDIPILARMDAVMEYLVDEYETLYNRNLPEDEVEEIREKFNRMYVTRDIYKIYNWFLEDSGYETLAKIPYENRKLQYEDVFPVLYLKYRMLGGTRHKHIKHLVIDEMQDYSYLQYVVLSRLFSCRMTILGDRAQTLDSQMQDVLTFLPKIFGRTIRKIIMNKSYRNTIEIAEYAAKFTGEKDLEYLERHGKPVTEKTFDSDEELLNELIREADAGMDKYETAAVLTETMDEAYTMTRMLSNRGLPVNCIDRDSSTFEKGVTVTTFYMAKGLEFDQVFGVFPKKENPMTGQAKYICATRALHELYMYERA